MSASQEFPAADAAAETRPLTAHTPGPWQFYADTPSADPSWHVVTTANRLRVLANVHIEPGNATDLANARLITAAPDMLEALEKAADWLISTVADGAPLPAVQAAIAKARGEA